MEKKGVGRIYALLIVLLIAGAFALGWYFAGHGEFRKASEPKDAPVDSTLAFSAKEIINEDTAFEKNYVGFIVPIHEAEIQPYISGYLDQILVQGGENVCKGQVLVTLRQDEYIAQVAAAEADVLKAEATFKNAEAYYKRIEKAGVKAVSQTEIENAQAQFFEARAALEQAKANYALAQVNFDYTVIRAPISGVVGDVSLTRGNYVSPSGGALFSIVQYSPIRVVFSITDKEYLAELEKPRPFEGDEILVKLADGSLFPNKGQIEYTENSVNKTTNAVAVYAKFENIGKLLTPNAYVTVLRRHIYKNSVQILKSAVSLEEDGNFVYIIRNNHVEKVPVKILASGEQNFIVENTFEKGDSLITQPVTPADVGKPARPVFETAEGQK